MKITDGTISVTNGNHHVLTTISVMSKDEWNTKACSTEAVEIKQISQQEAERARFLVEKVHSVLCQ